MSYNTILFDLDGTITDSKEGIINSVKYSLEKLNVKIEDENVLLKFIGPPLKDSYAKYFNLDNQTAELAIEKYREYYCDKGIFENYVYDGIEELLSKLKEQGKTIIMATSKPHIFANKIVDYFNLKKYFDYISGSETDSTRVKKNEVIEYALKEMDITDLSNVVMIGDREHDIIGAKKNNIDVIGVLYGYGDLEELTNAGATYISRDVESIFELVR